MSRLSQSQKIVEFLKKNPNQKFNARQIAEQIVGSYPEDYRDKRQNPRFGDEKAFLSQVVAEIGSQKDQIVKNDAHIFWQDKPRPRVYWYNPEKIVGQIEPEIDETEDENIEASLISETIIFSEHCLYPILIDYLKTELNLYCQRINEKRSINSHGSSGYQWLHLDIVAMQPVDKEWNDLIRSCVKQGAGQSVRLWSFEVKKELTGSNVRKSFFQAVSNSSWANEGYLVATSISDSNVEQELRMLSALHGIGVILLNPENPSESEMMLPAKSRAEVDWQSVNRILVENADFKDYIELVSTYYQTGRVRARDWNK
ncbi:COG2958 family protein [Oceanisphaera avium]|uniref:HrgA protein n=1 Tax=Oceanisphaera avium TaxID=1903694 RepID=A0A1Y0CYA3_9GAMM|nr:HrgA protein [Oceanisphaera avium]ART80004.1 HrgA protein [Oceanisphaera avium]